MSGECEWGKGKGKRAIGAHGQGVVELNYVKKKTNNGQKTIKISLKTGRKERDHCTHLRDKQDIKNQAHKEGGGVDKMGQRASASKDDVVEKKSGQKKGQIRSNTAQNKKKWHDDLLPRRKKLKLKLKLKLKQKQM